MIVETAIVGALALSSFAWRININNYKEKQFTKKWDGLMKELRIESKLNKFTFKIIEYKECDNGCKLKINIPDGLTYEDLEKYNGAVENTFKSLVVLEKIRFTSVISMQLISQDIGKFEFEPVKAYPNQLYIGKKFDGTDYFIDVRKACHILIGGTTGTGKTYLLSSILTNLIYNSGNSIEIHLSQIMKGEVGLFANCKQVKFCGYNLREVAFDLSKIAKTVDTRSKKFTHLGVKNLDHYNKHFKTSRMKRIFFVLEEISFFMPGNGEDDETRELKEICWNSILTIVKAGRSSGVHLLSVTQRSTTTNLPSDVKSQMCRISFRQISGIDSRNIIECDNAMELEDRECLVYGTGEKMQPIKTPFIDDDFKILNKYVREIKIPQINKQEIKIDQVKEKNQPEKQEIIDVEFEEIKLKLIEAPKKKNKTKKRTGVIEC